MALSGLFLVAFLVAHAGLNACIWANDDGKMFNKAAYWMGSNWVPRVLEIGLFAFFLIHIIQGIVLELQNRTKRGKGYAINLGNRGSKWYSRAMGILGALILIFLVFHLIDFWIPSRFGGLEEITYPNDPVVYHNLYGEMGYKFTTYPLLGIVYFVGVVALFWHLMHGVESSFRTLGVTNRRYLNILKWFGWIFAFVICLTFLMMPVSFYLGWIQ